MSTGCAAFTELSMQSESVLCVKRKKERKFWRSSCKNAETVHACTGNALGLFKDSSLDFAFWSAIESLIVFMI